MSAHRRIVQVTALAPVAVMAATVAQVWVNQPVDLVLRNGTAAHVVVLAAIVMLAALCGEGVAALRGHAMPAIAMLGPLMLAAVAYIGAWAAADEVVDRVAQLDLATRGVVFATGIINVAVLGWLSTTAGGALFAAAALLFGLRSSSRVRRMSSALVAGSTIVTLSVAAHVVFYLVPFASMAGPVGSLGPWWLAAALGLVLAGAAARPDDEEALGDLALAALCGAASALLFAFALRWSLILIPLEAAARADPVRVLPALAREFDHADRAWVGASILALSFLGAGLATGFACRDLAFAALRRWFAPAIVSLVLVITPLTTAAYHHTLAYELFHSLATEATRPATRPVKQPVRTPSTSNPSSNPSGARSNPSSNPSGARATTVDALAGNPRLRLE